MFNNDFYDIETEPIIDFKSLHTEQKHKVKKCLIIFSLEIVNYLLKNFTCEKIEEIYACNGNIPIYVLEYKGEKIAFYLTGVGSAVASSICYEVHLLTGATDFVMFGSCGSLNNEKTKGKFIVPTESYRGDGCSYYYAPASDYIKIKNSDRLASVFEKNKVPFVQGKAWTTDSILRETKGLAAKRVSEGCIAVEMELAGVQALCDFYGLQLFDFLEAGDVLSESEYKIDGLQKANHSCGKVLIALEVAVCL